MNIPRLGLLLAILLASSKEAIAVGNDGRLVVDVQDEAIFDPASTQTQKKIDSADDDAVLSSPTMPSSQGTSSPTNNLRQHVQPMHIDRRLDGHSSSFTKPFIDDLLHHHDHLRHAEPHAPDKPDDLTHHLLRGGVLPRMDDGVIVTAPEDSAVEDREPTSAVADPTSTDDRRLAVVGMSVVTKSSDNIANPEEGSLRWALNTQNSLGGAGYGLIKFQCPLDGGNTIELLGDLLVTRDKIAIDATSCDGGVTVKDANWSPGGASPTSPAPIIRVQSSADSFIYRGMHHIRVPVIVDGFGAMISHNHFEWYREYSFDNDDAEGALVLRSASNLVSHNEFSNDQRCIVVTGDAHLGNILFQNYLHSENPGTGIYGIWIKQNAGTIISQNRVIVGSPIYHSSISQPDEPSLRYEGPGSTENPVPDPTCSQSDGSVTLSAVTPVLLPGSTYTIEIFSKPSSTADLDHFVGSVSDTLTGSDTKKTHVITLPCVNGDYLRATITTGGQTSDISNYAIIPSPGWSNNCGCGVVVGEKCNLEDYDAYCPKQGAPGVSPVGECIDLSSNPEHCGSCGHSCPLMSDYEASSNALNSICENSLCDYGSNTASDSDVLHLFDFELDTTPTLSCNGAAFYSTNGIGDFFDTVSDSGISFTFEEKPAPPQGEITTEVVVLNGVLSSSSSSGNPGANIYSGGTDIGGYHALGMFSTDFNSKQDQFLIRFDANNQNYIIPQFDMSAAGFPQGECLTNSLSYGTGSYRPVMHVILTDWQEPFDWDNIVPLDECIVSGADRDGPDLEDPVPFDIVWNEKLSCSLRADESETDEVALMFNFEGGEFGAKYGIVDNIEIAASSDVGFSQIEFEEGVDVDVAHISLNTNVGGSIGIQVWEEDCSAIASSTNPHLTLSVGGGDRSTAISFSPYAARETLQVDMHLEQPLLDLFASDQSMTSYPACLKFFLHDSSGARVDQKVVRLSIELDVSSMTFSLELAVDVDVGTATLSQPNEADVGLVDENGVALTGSNVFSPGDTVSYKVVASSPIQTGTIDSDLISPAPVGTLPLFENGVVNPDSDDLSPTFSIDSVNTNTAIGTINLSPVFLSAFSQGEIPMSISGSVGVTQSARRRLSGGMVGNEPFAVPFSVKVPKKEGLSATASGVFAASLIILFASAFAFVSYKQRPRSSVSPDQKSVSSITACPTISSTKTSRSYDSASSSRHFHPNRKSAGGIETSYTVSSTKGPAKYHSSSSRNPTSYPTQGSSTAAKVCTAPSSSTSRDRHPARPARPSRPTHPLKSISEIRFSPASVVALNAKMVSDRPKY